jgi:hypothetical protein
MSNYIYKRNGKYLFLIKGSNKYFKYELISREYNDETGAKKGLSWAKKKITELVLIK